MSDIRPPINDENWFHTHYFSNGVNAFISVGGEPSPNAPEEVIESYYVTTADRFFSEISQKSFASLEEALSELNKNFSEWRPIDRSKTQKGGCCSSGCHC